MSKLFILETDKAFHLVEDDKIILTEEKSISLSVGDYAQHGDAHAKSLEALEASEKVGDGYSLLKARKAVRHSAVGDHAEAIKAHDLAGSRHETYSQKEGDADHRASRLHYEAKRLHEKEGASLN